MAGLGALMTPPPTHRPPSQQARERPAPRLRVICCRSVHARGRNVHDRRCFWTGEADGRAPAPPQL
eukprot:3397244-Prymnesium_polylepis.1